MTAIQFAPLNSILLFILNIMLANILPAEYSDEYPAGWHLVKNLVFPKIQALNPRWWTWQTYRQGSVPISRVGYFWTTQKNTLLTENPLTGNPKKYFPKSKTLKNTLKNTIHFAKVEHDMIIMETDDYWSTCWIKLDPKKVLLKTWNTLKYSFYLTTQKIQQLWPVPRKIQILETHNPKNTLLIHVCKYAKSTPWAPNGHAWDPEILDPKQSCLPPNFRH